MKYQPYSLEHIIFNPPIAITSKSNQNLQDIRLKQHQTNHGAVDLGQNRDGLLWLSEDNDDCSAVIFAQAFTDCFTDKTSAHGCNC